LAAAANRKYTRNMPDRFTQKDHTEEAGEQAKACNIFLFIVIFFITRLLRYQILYVDIYISCS
jgi:hypothetical protein